MNGQGGSNRPNNLVQPQQPLRPSPLNVQSMAESKTNHSYSKFPKVLNKDADEIVKDFHKVSLKEAVVHWEEEEEHDEENNLEDEKEAQASNGSGKEPMVGRPPGQGEYGTRHKHLVLSRELADPKRYINGLFWIRGIRTVSTDGSNQQRRDVGQQFGSLQNNSSQLGTNLPMDQSK